MTKISKKEYETLFAQDKFKHEVLKKMYQLKRSKLEKMKIEKELNDVRTPEQAKEYIKSAGELAVKEIKEKNQNAKR